MSLVYNLKLTIQLLTDGDYKYMATSPDFPNLIVVGDTIDEVLAEVPLVARALLEVMQEIGQPIPAVLQPDSMPYQALLPIAL